MNTRTLTVSIVLIAGWSCLAASYPSFVPPRPVETIPAVKTYGHAAVAKIIAVDEIYTFRCNIAGWPGVIAEDIAVRLDHVAAPMIVIQGGKPNKFFQLQVKGFMDKALHSAGTIKLKNIKRGEMFSLIAEVIVDSNSLAGLLIESQLARHFAGEIKDIPAGQTVVASSSEGANALPGNQQTSHQLQGTYVASKSSKIFHRSTCRYAKTISEKNNVTFAARENALHSGRRPCQTCNP